MTSNTVFPFASSGMQCKFLLSSKYTCLWLILCSDRTRSPVPGLSPQEVYNVCECISNGQFQPAARVGDKSSSGSTKTVTVTKTVARTTARSVPILTTGVSTVTRKSTITQKQTVTQKSTVTIRSTVTAQPTNAGKASTVTVTKKSTATIARSTVTQKSTVTLAKTTMTQKSTVTIARTTITVKNANAVQTTMFKTVTLNAVGSAQKTVTATSKVTVTSKASSAPTRTVTVTSKASSTPPKTVTVTALASSAAQRTVTSTKTVTSVQTSVKAAGTTTKVVTTTVTNSKSVAASTTNSKSVAATTAAASTAASSSASASSQSASISSSAAASTTPATSTTDAPSGTAASSSTDPNATCTRFPSEKPPTIVTIADTQYERFYRGCGFTEDPNNPGNAYYSDNFPPITTTYNSTLNATEAVMQCANDAFYEYPDPNQYLSFDLHFISTSGEGLAGDGGAGYWECVQYFSEQSDTDASPYFNVSNPAVSVAYGYSSGLYSDAAAAAASQNSKRSVELRVSESSHFHPEGRGHLDSYFSVNSTNVSF